MDVFERGHEVKHERARAGGVHGVRVEVLAFKGVIYADDITMSSAEIVHAGGGEKHCVIKRVEVDGDDTTTVLSRLDSDCISRTGGVWSPLLTCCWMDSFVMVFRLG